MPDLSWLTEPNAPWWATVGAPIATFWLGQRFANRGAAEQRTADLQDREKERTANLAAIEKQIDGDRLKSAEERIDQAKIVREDTVREAFGSALDAIANLHGALSLSAADPEYGPADETGKREMIADAKPVETATLQAFIGAMNRLRLFDGDRDLAATELTRRVSRYMELWSFDGPGGRNADSLKEDLALLADKVSAVYRVRHAKR